MNLKKTIKLSIMMVTMLSFVASPTLSYAASPSETENYSYIDSKKTAKIDLNYYENSPYFTVIIDGDFFEIELTRAGMLKYCQDNNILEPTPYMTRASGTTKIVGSVLSGTFKVFIKKSDLNFIANRGSSAVGLIFGGLPGFVVGSIVAYIAPGNYAHGRVFVYQGYNYQYWYYQ